MAFLLQNMNQSGMLPILGAVDMIPTPDIITAQINPASTFAFFQQTSAVKLIAGTSGAILVDAQTGPTDAALLGVIPYNPQKNKYKAGDLIEVAQSGSYIYCRSSAAIARGARVSMTAATSTSDPVVTTDATSGHFTLGICQDTATAADQLVRIKVSPLTNP